MTTAGSREIMDWKKILVAVDDTPTSENALQYTGNMVGHLPDVSLHLLHIYPEPPPDYYATGGSLDQYRAEREKIAAGIFSGAMEILTGCGIKTRSITTESRMAERETISQTILEVQRERGFGTIAVGKRGVSKAEEFLFGSISNALVHQSRGIAVWVVG